MQAAEGKNDEEWENFLAHGVLAKGVNDVGVYTEVRSCTEGMMGIGEGGVRRDWEWIMVGEGSRRGKP